MEHLLQLNDMNTEPVNMYIIIYDVLIAYVYSNYNTTIPVDHWLDHYTLLCHGRI